MNPDRCGRLTNEKFRCAALLAVLAVGSSAAQGKPGDFDANFGNGGVMLTPVSTDGDDFGTCMAVQSDGKIVVGGTASNGSNDDFALVRYLPGGTPDPGFGTGGKVTTPISGGIVFATCAALQPDGKIILAGYALIGNSTDFVVVRYRPDGTPDPGFGTGGKVTTDIGGGFNAHAFAVALQPDGKIVVAGDYRSNFALVRYDAGGVPDPGFGTDGKVSSASTGTERYAYSMVLQSDGKIVVAGRSLAAGNTDFAIGRYLPNGTPDGTFGTGGRVSHPVGAGNTADIARSVVLQPDGKILAAGLAGTDYAIIRCGDNGGIDSEFGVSGKSTVDFGGATDTAYGVAVQSDGKIIAGGTSRYNGSNYASLARLTAGGTLDPSFGNQGGVIVPLGNAGTEDDMRALSLQADGRILLAGFSGSGFNHDFAVARFEGTSPVTLADWRQTWLGSPDNSGDGANLFDFDKDGMVNLLEYAFGQNPALGGPPLLPSGKILGENFVIHFSQPATVTGIVYGAEWSTTMTPGSWTPLTDSGGAGQHVFSVPMEGKPALSVRLKVTAP